MRIECSFKTVPLRGMRFSSSLFLWAQMEKQPGSELLSQWSHLCCSPFLLVCRLRTGSRVGHRLLSHNDWWRKMTQTNQSKPFQGSSNKQTDLGQCYFGRTYCCLPCGGRPSFSEKEGNQCTKQRCYSRWVSHAHGWPASSTVAVHSLKSLSLCEEPPQDPSTYFFLHSLSVACK